MIKKKTKSKRYEQIIEDKCPECGHKLAIWLNRTKGNKFIGCSTFPDCKYSEGKTLIDFIKEGLEIPLTWRPKKSASIEAVMYRCQSRAEKQYLLGAVYYINTNDFDYAPVNYKNIKYFGLTFSSVYGNLNMGGYTPTSLAIVPQVHFGNKSHHDFGIFCSGEKFPSENDWQLELAVEIDYYPSHEWNSSVDEYRDSLVTYRVLRLKKGDNPLKWFQRVEGIYNTNVENELENLDSSIINPKEI